MFFRFVPHFTCEKPDEFGAFVTVRLSRYPMSTHRPHQDREEKVGIQFKCFLRENRVGLWAGG